MIKLSIPLVFNNYVQPACLPPANYPYAGKLGRFSIQCVYSVNTFIYLGGTPALLSGWGCQWENEMKMNKIYSLHVEKRITRQQNIT